MLESLRTLHPVMPAVAGILLLIVVAIVADLVAKRLLLGIVRVAVSRSRYRWDDALLQHNVFGRLAQIVPAVIVYLGIAAIPGVTDGVIAVVRNVANAYMVVVAMLAVMGILAAVNQIYESRPDSGDRPIKGFVQLGQIAVFIVGSILVIAALIDRSPVILLSGFGAMTAVLLLVFKDTILSLVASLQLTGQDMIRVGDWLEMPQFGADGDVIDVTLYTVKVQNWDKTITTIPTYRLVSDSFKNWRGMQLSGGRRIKRSVKVDLGTVRFLSDDEIERFRGFALLREYIGEKEAELREYNAALDDPGDSGVNLRRLTNLGTFRAYIRNYIANHPRIHEDMTRMVRQLQPDGEGLPIEIYCFTATTDWLEYEGIQADLFDQVCAIAPAFGLRLYQQPSGADLSAAAALLSESRRAD